MIGVASSSTAFADIDNDNDIDLLIAGSKANSNDPYTQLYKNDGSGNYYLVSSPFTWVRNGTVAFSDVDNDLDQDVLITGFDTLSQYVAEMYLNDGFGNFTLANGTPFEGVQYSTIDFADVDNDLDQDVLITGINGVSISAKLYLNDGAGNFVVDTFSPFTGVHEGSIAFADIENDNDIDVLISGRPNGSSNSIIQLYKNDGFGNFSLVPGTSFVSIYQGDISFADIDNDNDFDVLITGRDNSSQPTTNLYTNDGLGSFTLVQNAPFPDVYYSSCVFADFDNDNDQDLLICGWDGSTALYTNIFKNNGSGIFNLNNGTPFPGFKSSSIAIVDVDNDNDKDIIITGFGSGVGTTSKLFINSPCTTVFGIDNITTCDSLLWIDGNTYYNSNATNTYNIMAGSWNGCDSLVTLNLTINHSTAGTDVITACDSYTWIDGVTYTSNNNTATHNISGGATNGCDSVVLLDLTVYYGVKGPFHTEKVLTGAADLPYNGRTIIQDNSGNIYIAGIYRNTVDLDFGVGVDNYTSNGYGDVFIQKIDVSGNLIWTKTFGTAGDESVSGIVTDDLGSIYLTGAFNSNDLFINKLDSSGNLLWTKTIGGFGIDKGTSIDVDPVGNVCIVGYYSLTVDFDPGSGINNLTSLGNYDTFILKLSSNGVFIWAKSVGGSSSASGKEVKIDSLGNIYVLGQFEGTCDFNPGSVTNNRTSNGNYDFFLLKLNSNGDFSWVHSYGSSAFDEGQSLVLDASDNILVGGSFQLQANFSNYGINHNIWSNGGFDYFIMKVDQLGNTLWARGGGGDSNDEIQNITTDINSNIYVTGYFSGTADLSGGFGSKIQTTNGGDDFFISKFDGDGYFKGASSFGGNSSDDGRGICVDNNENTYVIGKFSNTVDFDSDTSSINLTSINSSDLFFLKYNDGSISDEITTCSPYTWIDGNTYTSSTNTPTFTLSNSLGCDSVVTLDLTINNLIASNNIIANGNGNYSFTNTSTGNFNQTHWAFGDGTTSTQTNPNHTFSANGAYVVVLTINDSTTNSSCIDYYMDTVVVTGVPSPAQCVAGFVMYPDTGINNVTVVNSSTGTNLTYLWDFGDGNTSTQQFPSHTYATAGNYYLCLTVDDGAGCVDMYCDSIGENGVVFKGTGFTINVIAPPIVTGVNNDIELSSEVRLYPNPTSTQLTIDTQLKIKEIVVTDLTGKIIKSLIPKSNIINVSDLSNGIYFIKIVGEDETAIQKFMKE